MHRRRTFEQRELISAVVVIALVFGIYAFGYWRHMALGEQASYLCKEGVLNVSYKDDQVIVRGPFGVAYKLPQAISASGARYEGGDVVFWNKGENAFMTKGNTDLYTSCVEGRVRHISRSSNLFINAADLFSITYPSEFSAFGGDIGYTENWKVHRNEITLGKILFRVAAPLDWQPGTNLREVVLTLGSSSDPEAIKSCTLSEDKGVKALSVVINKTPFTKLTFSDAGAGNFYETTSYRTVRDDSCYALEYTIHSLNVYNFPKEQHIAEFEKKQVVQTFDLMVNSFVFK